MTVKFAYEDLKNIHFNCLFHIIKFIWEQKWLKLLALLCNHVNNKRLFIALSGAVRKWHSWRVFWSTLSGTDARHSHLERSGTNELEKESEWTLVLVTVSIGQWMVRYFNFYIICVAFPPWGWKKHNFTCIWCELSMVLFVSSI